MMLKRRDPLKTLTFVLPFLFVLSACAATTGEGTDKDHRVAVLIELTEEAQGLGKDAILRLLNEHVSDTSASRAAWIPFVKTLSANLTETEIAAVLQLQEVSAISLDRQMTNRQKAPEAEK